jgi:hypothetical protein
VNTVGISGLANSGKDTAAGVLIARFGFIQVGFADALKRVVMRLWPLFIEEILWGPSYLRGTTIPQYGKLTARRACQFIGTEVGRELDPDVWVRQIEATIAALAFGGCRYHRTCGVYAEPSAAPPQGVVVSDTRFSNEAAAIHAAGGRVWRIDRPGAGLKGEAGTHASETGIADLHVDGIIRNDRSLEDFQETVEQFAEIAGFKMVQR